MTSRHFKILRARMAIERYGMSPFIDEGGTHDHSVIANTYNPSELLPKNLKEEPPRITTTRITTEILSPRKSYFRRAFNYLTGRNK
jgi:hypothetical protein